MGPNTSLSDPARDSSTFEHKQPQAARALLGSDLLTPIAAYLGAVILSIFGSWLLTRDPTWSSTSGTPFTTTMNAMLGVSMAGMLFVVAVSYLTTKWPSASWRSLSVFFVGFTLFEIANRISPFHHSNAYGDAGEMGERIVGGTFQPRWLMGFGLMKRLYRSIAAVVLARSPHLTAEFVDPVGMVQQFVCIAGAVVMLIATLSLLFWSRGALRVVLPLLTPIWLLFMSSYNEYYPFIAWALVAVPAFLIAKPLRERNPFIVGVMVAVFAMLYIVYIPLALIVLVAFWISAGAKKGGIATVVAPATCLILIPWLWGGNINGLREEWTFMLLLGELGNQWAPYSGSISESTPFFLPAYALSVSHAKELIQWLFLGIGPAPFVLLSMIPIRQSAGHLWSSPRRRNGSAAVLAIIAALAVYFVVMVPKLGPVMDLDLYGPFYLASAFGLGLLCDARRAMLSPERRTQLGMTAIAAGLGSSLPIFTFLILR